MVSEQDNAIPPDTERFMAKRMEVVTESVNGAHLHARRSALGQGRVTGERAAVSSVSLRTTAIWFSRSRAQARALAGEFDAPENS